jgi:hypothetical protein
MQQFESMRHTVLGFTGKGKSTLLGVEAAVAYLIDMIDLRQTVHHVTISQPPQPPKI